MKAVFWLVTMVSTQISRSRFKQSRMSMLIKHIYVFGPFCVSVHSSVYIMYTA